MAKKTEICSAVNPFHIQKGDLIATSTRTTFDGQTIATKSRKVNRVDFCGSSPEKVHLDGECYDARFGKVYRVHQG